MADNYTYKRNGIQKFLGTVSFTPLGVICLVVLLILPLVPPFNKEYVIRWLTSAVFIGACAVAFDFTNGYINIVNFGFNAFIGLGAYTSALVSIHFNISPWFGMLFGALATAILGFVVGLMTLRLRGLFAACLTWFVGLALMGLATKWVNVTRGQLGLNCPGLLESTSNLPYYYVIAIMMIISLIITRYITRSYIGLAFKGIGQNMEAARTSGINPVKYRLINFTISCAFAGWLGGFYAFYYKILTPELLHTSKTIEVLVISYIGGRGSLWGGVFAALPFVFAMEFIRSSLANIPGLNLMFYAVFLVLVMIYYPGGFSQLYDKLVSISKSKIINYLTGKRKKSL